VHVKNGVCIGDVGLICTRKTYEVSVNVYLVCECKRTRPQIVRLGRVVTNGNGFLPFGTQKEHEQYDILLQLKKRRVQDILNKITCIGNILQNHFLYIALPLKLF
jgi:hypothetical protein